MSDHELVSYLDAQRFYFLAEQCLNIIQKSLSQVLREHGLNHSQHLILLILRYSQFSGVPVMSTDIAYLLGLEKHSVTSVVDRLVEAGLVSRERSESDRRVVHLALTDSGGTLACDVQERTMNAISVVPPQATDEFQRMCRFLKRLRKHIADASGQPDAAYERAYQRLLIDGQTAFRDCPSRTT